MSSGRAIVYFAFLGDEFADPAMVARRLGFAESQLRWLAQLIARSAEPIEAMLAYVAPRDADAALHHAAAVHGFAVDPASVAGERINSFEYPGFRAMRALARASDPGRPIYYCHSKGIGQLSPGKMGLFRLHSFIELTADLRPMAEDPAITRAGLFPSRWGWCWYNFFWIEAGHMARLAVERSDDRFHYEALIGDGADELGYRGVLPLIDRLPLAMRGIGQQEWYRPSETSSPALEAAYARFAAMDEPPVAIG